MDARFADYDTVVFDIGGVLLTFEPEKILQELVPDESRDRIRSAMFGKDWQWARFDLGRDPNGQIAEEIARVTGVPEDKQTVLQVVDRFHLCMEEMPLASTLKELKKQGKRVYLLTNYPQPSLSHAMERFDFFRLIDGYVCSSEEKCVKPGEEIFRILCSRYGIDPAGTLYVDDNAPNTERAALMGFDTWTYRRDEKERASPPVSGREDQTDRREN